MDFSKLMESKNFSMINEDNKPENENLKAMIDYCNTVKIKKNKIICLFYFLFKKVLSNFGFSKIGNLKGNVSEVTKTINVINDLLHQRQRDIEFREEFIGKMTKIEYEKTTLANNVQRLKKENDNLQKENAQLINYQKMIEKKSKNEREKIILEKDEINKQFSKNLYKESQLQHELRKKETEVNRIKEQMRKSIVEKNSKNSNNFEIVNNFQSLKEFQKNNEFNEYSVQISKKYEKSIKKLLSENQEMRNTLIKLQNDLNSIFRDQKDGFVILKLKIFLIF